jgi:hypothetical protein
MQHQVKRMKDMFVHFSGHVVEGISVDVASMRVSPCAHWPFNGHDDQTHPCLQTDQF